MHKPSLYSGSSPNKSNRLGKRSKDTPSDNFVLKSFNALRNITAVQALVGLAALGVTGYVASRVSTDESTIEEQERVAANIKPYTPELYPTAESRVAYLRDKYGIDASVLDRDRVSYENKVTVRTEIDECGCKKVYFSERDLPRKVKVGDPKHFLGFLDGICRAVDQYPIDIFRQMRGLKLDMSGEITRGDISEGSIGGYADGPSHIVMDGSHGNVDTQEIFHHEFLHALDYKHHNLESDDNQWMAKIGLKDTSYAGYSVSFSHAPWGPPPGFARKYGMASVPEDQATMGEYFFQPHYLKFMIRRAIMGDEALRMRIQLMTACVIDPITERFSRTMTAQDYSAYSGFDGYRYYRAWSSKMDHTFWNSQLDTASSEINSRKHTARNMYDAIADLIFHIIGGDYVRAGRHVEAAKSYHAAHEPKLAMAEQRTAALESEKRGDFSTAASMYDAMGEKEKARALHEKSALESVSRRLYSQAAIGYARAGRLLEARKYALEFFQQYHGRSNLRLMAGDTEIFVMDDTLMSVAQECYDWKSLPDIAIDLLHTMAKKRGGLTAITIYEKLGEVPEKATASVRLKNKDKKHPDPIDTEALVDQWYLKHAKRLEAEGKQLDQVALLYEKAGRFDEARRCLQLSMNVIERDWFQLAGVFRTFADLASREEKVKEKKSSGEVLK